MADGNRISVVVCGEDRATANFGYHLLMARRTSGRPFVVDEPKPSIHFPPPGQGSGRQRLDREIVPKFLKAHRSLANANPRKGLLVVLDGDSDTRDERLKTLAEAIQGNGLPALDESDKRVCVLVARREIECWQIVLRGGPRSEETFGRLEMTKKADAHDCKPLVRKYLGSTRSDAKAFAENLPGVPVAQWLSSMNESAKAYLDWEQNYA